MKIPLGENTYERLRAGEPINYVTNRYYEVDPTNQVENMAFVVRPALTARTQAGTGPIRNIYTCPGAFDDDMFVVSGDRIYRIHKEFGQPDVVIPIENGTIAGNDAPDMTAVTHSDGNSFLYVADGTVSFQYVNEANTLNMVTVPDTQAVRSVASINGFVLLSIKDSDRFYWIEPGETAIDPINFATTERSPDPINNIVVIGDQIWFFNEATTEVWYMTGDATAPFQRTQGRLFDRGVWQGTATAVKDQTFLVGQDGIVYEVSGQPRRVSTNGIEEMIRKAIRLQED